MNDGQTAINAKTRNRVNAFQGQPAPPVDRSWVVPGEAPHRGPDVKPEQSSGLRQRGN